MSGTGEVTADFAGEARTFRIQLGEIRHIEAKCGTGIGEVLRRLSRAVLVTAKLNGIDALAAGLDIHADDVRETIYRGLRGGGMADAQATGLVRREIDEGGLRNLVDHVPTALKVLWGSQEAPETDAPEDDPSGEPRAGESPATPKSASTSESSTESAPPSD